MRIVVDTNIVFSALIGSGNTIPDIFFAGLNRFQFYVSRYVSEELENNKSKLLQASKMTEEKLDLAISKFFDYLNVVSLEIIPQNIWLEAEALTFDIDPDDISFVALSIFLDAYLWTGDKVLYNGLIRKGFDRVLLTSEMANL